MIITSQRKNRDDTDVPPPRTDNSSYAPGYGKNHEQTQNEQNEPSIRCAPHKTSHARQGKGGPTSPPRRRINTKREKEKTSVNRCRSQKQPNIRPNNPICNISGNLFRLFFKHVLCLLEWKPSMKTIGPLNNYILLALAVVITTYITMYNIPTY